MMGRSAVADAVTGRCEGGPLDGADVTVRSADGFLAVDKAAGLAWMYTRQGDGSFAVCLDHDDSLIYPQGMTSGVRHLDMERAVAAAADSKLDVVAVPGGQHG